MSRKYVGFGFGPIQTGLMLLEALDSGSFDGYTISEVDPALVALVRGSGGTVTVNVARSDGIERRTLSGFWIGNPAVPADRERIVAAIREADELATAIPSVKLYGAGGRDSIAGLLAEGLDAGKARILYAAENHNYAARLLTAEVGRLAALEMSLTGGAPTGRLARFQALDTVIGKMSGVIQDPAVMAGLGLAPLVPGAAAAGGAGGGLQPHPGLPGAPARLPAGDRGVRGEGRPAALRGGQALRAQRHPLPAGLPGGAARLWHHESHRRRR